MLQLIVYKTRLDLSFLPESNESDLGPNIEDIRRPTPTIEEGARVQIV